MKESVVGTKEAARRLGVSVRTIQLWVESGALDAWKTSGGHRRISESSLNRVLSERSATESSVSRSRCDVLIVEDDLTMQAYYRALFDILKPNATLEFAADGFEGLVGLGKFDPELVIVDVDMPGMNGVEMINAIDRSKLCEHIQIVVITGLSKQQVLQRGEIANDIAIFPKPINVEDLRQLLRDGQTKQRNDP